MPPVPHRGAAYLKQKGAYYFQIDGCSGYSQHFQSSQISEDVGWECCQGVVVDVPFARGGKGDGGRVNTKPLQQSYTIYVVLSVIDQCHGAPVRWEPMLRSTEMKVPRFGGSRSNILFTNIMPGQERSLTGDHGYVRVGTHLFAVTFRSTSRSNSVPHLQQHLLGVVCETPCTQPSQRRFLSHNEDSTKA